VAPGDLAALTGNNPFIADFLRSEFFAQLPPHELRFLTATSMLEQLCRPLCDAVLASSGSADILESLAHSNRFVVSLDRDRAWYRCHPLVRDLLAAELARSRPDLLSPMLRRASDWCAANGHEIAAIRYAQNNGDPDRVAGLMERWTMPVFQSGRTTTVEHWFDWLDAHGGLSGYPSVAVIGTMFHAVMGQPTASERCAELARAGHVRRGAAGRQRVDRVVARDAARIPRARRHHDDARRRHARGPQPRPYERVASGCDGAAGLGDAAERGRRRS
jgi:LuxR family maltose regulon positive regulatory protein